MEKPLAVVPATPATSTTAAVPSTDLRTFLAPGPNGSSLTAQAFVLVDEHGRVVAPMSEATGRELVAAIRQLHECLASTLGGLPPV